MKNHVKLTGSKFWAYIPAEADLWLENEGKETAKITVTGVKPDTFCLVNGIKYFGSPLDIFLNSNTQWGNFKNNCEIIETINGHLNVGQILSCNLTDTVSEGMFRYRPITENKEREEYVLKIIPDYPDLLKDFFEEYPEIDQRIVSFLSQHPDYLDQPTQGIIKINPEKWIHVSRSLEMEEDWGFMEINIGGLVGPDTAKMLVEFLKKIPPKKE